MEDNELNSEIAAEILNEYGFLVDTAENGAEAVEKVKNSKPGNYDLVLMDVQMPVMNGYEATKQIRALDNPALAGITILAMTANAFDEDKKKALECGMDGFLSKPIVIEELIDAFCRRIWIRYIVYLFPHFMIVAANKRRRNVKFRFFRFFRLFKIKIIRNSEIRVQYELCRERRTCFAAYESVYG